MDSNRYYVVMMDIVQSTKLTDRNKLTRQLTKSMDEVNRKYKQDFLAPFEITRGDEFSAVLFNIDNLYGMIKIFQKALFPIEFRTVAAYGKLNAGLESKQSSVIDGPAFQHADSMMHTLKKKLMTFAIDTGLKDWDRIIQAALNLLLWQWNGFTPLQQRIVRLYQKHRNQKKAAEEINRSQQQVQAALESCRWELIDEAENSVSDAFRVMEKTVKDRTSK